MSVVASTVCLLRGAVVLIIFIELLVLPEKWQNLFQISF